jgi:hypothetical protein
MTSSTTFSTLNPGKQAQIVADLMDLFKSNSRGYGLGEFQGARFEEDKNKWIPGHVRWTWGETTPAQWHDHLAGVRLLGQGVLCDDGCVWYACLDIDSYEIDYADEMRKIKNSKLPLVVFRTKSGGLRITVFFCESIEAELVITRMRRISSSLGYAGCEIFPKQTKLEAAKGDCPSWIYVPFGGTHDIFPEQGCMNELGNLMELPEAVAHMKDMRIGKSQFMEMFAAEEAAKTNGKTNGKKHPKGAWVEEETYETTINTMFWDGPPCMWIISHRRSRDMQNNFLIDVSTFLKKKYPENWDKALEWVNANVLQPVGSAEKLLDIIKRVQRHDYEYMCHQEPICSFCDPHACRRKPYGVGAGNGGIDHFELGLTEILRIPRVYFANVGEGRMMFEAEDLLSQFRYQKKCVDHGIPPPPTRKKDDWESFIRKNMESATKVDPSHAMRTNASEIEFLTRWLDILVPTYMRVGSKGREDAVRVKIEERRIYLKDGKLMRYCLQLNYDDKSMRKFLENNCKYHSRTEGRDWFRSTYSVSFDLIDEEYIEKWLTVEQEDSR